MALSGKNPTHIIIDDPAKDVPLSELAFKNMQRWYDREMYKALVYQGSFHDDDLIAILNQGARQRMLWDEMDAQKRVHDRIDAMADAAQAEIAAMAHDAQVFFHRSFGQVRRYQEARALDALRRYDTDGYDRVMDFLQMNLRMGVSEAVDLLVLERDVFYAE